jgi:hypothetical protein
VIAAPPPCVVAVDALCVASPFGDVLAAHRGIIPERVSPEVRTAAVARLGAQIEDDGGDGLEVETPPAGFHTECRGSVCMRYDTSCGGGQVAPYCVVTLYLPYRWPEGFSPGKRDPTAMLRREVAIRAQSRAAFIAALSATYVMVKGQTVTLIPMTKMVFLKKIK